MQLGTLVSVMLQRSHIILVAEHKGEAKSVLPDGQSDKHFTNGMWPCHITFGILFSAAAIHIILSYAFC